MRILAAAALLVLIPAVVLGIVYVPLQDGRVFDWCWGVLAPAVGISWCAWQLVRPLKRA